MKKEKIDSALKFLNYQVLEFEYIKNNNYKKQKTEVFFDINHNVKIEDEKAFIEIEIQLFDKNFSKDNIPYFLKAKILGVFQIIDTEDLSIEQKNTFIQKNTLTILFPYLRALINSITMVAEKPGYVFPPINVISYLKQKNNQKK